MRDSMVFYRSFYEAIKELPLDVQAKVYSAIFEYSLNFNEVVLEGLPKTIFTLIKPQLDANNKRFENGKKGGIKKVDNNQTETKTEPKQNQTETKTEPNVNVNVNDNGNVNDNVIINQEIGDEIIIPKKTWKNDFEIYKENVRNGYREIMEDEAWFKKQREFYPNVDILKSIEKSCVNFWITEGGWKNKKKAKTETINWKNTFANAISQPQNKVYYDRNKDLSTTGNTKSGNYSARNDAEERRRSVDNLADLARAILQEP